MDHVASLTTKVAGLTLAACFLFNATMSRNAAADDSASSGKIPVIYDSDIGDDIDDTWALCLLLKSPELDVKLVVGDQGRTEYRAKLFAKLLEVAGRTDIPVGVGLDVGREGSGGQQAWVADYDLKSYPGKVLDDGVQAIIDTIMKSPEPVTVIAVGPLPNIKAALEREPRIAENARFVGMHGSVRVGYGGKADPAAEYNVRADAKACQAALSAPWDVTITPLDTCGLIQLRGEKFGKVRECKDPLAKALIENYLIWAKDTSWYAKLQDKATQQSSTLFDTVAVYLALSQELCKMETLPIRVTDDGMTIIDPAAKKMQVATEWKDMGAFEDFLVARLTGSCGAAACCADAPAKEGAWKSLFDGKTLDGWHPVGDGKWTVEDGAIVGRANKEKLYGLLFSDDQFDNFTVRFKFKVLTGDSGFYIRTIFKEPDQAHGNQVQVGLTGSGVGGIYESYGRGWVDKPSDELQKKILKDGDWNEMVIVANGGDIVVHVNGTKTAELKNDPGRSKGHFALQMHSGNVMHLMFKDIEMRCDQ